MSAGMIFSWANILLTNLLWALKKAIQKQDAKGDPFYFTGYLLDVLCASNWFLSLKWAWSPKFPHVHIYCKELWRENIYKEMYTICDHFIASVHKLFFGVDMPWILEVGWEYISHIGSWFFLKHFTYIWILGITTALNLLPRYVPDKILLKEFAFQLFEIGKIVSLIKMKVKECLGMIVSLGTFQILNHGHAQKELEDYLYFRWLPTLVRRHDSRGIIVSHFQRLVLTTKYHHEVYPDDSLFEGTKEFEKTLTCMKIWRILEERIAVLGQDPELEWLEWRRQCFEVGLSKEKDGEIEKEKETNEDPSDKDKMLPKEIASLKPKHS